MKEASERNYDLPANWYNRGEEKLQELLEEIKGETIETVVAEVVQETEIKRSDTNPFGEKLIDVILPLDPQNPKIKVKFYSINGKPIIFPLGKRCKMPESYYALHMNSQEKYMEAQEKMEENNYKEI